MCKKNFILELYRVKDSVFTTKEIGLMLGESNGSALKSRINYYKKKGVIRGIRRGVYVKPGYNELELANKIYTPSYISLETVLQKEGIIFQHYETIFVVSYLTRDLIVDSCKIRIRRIKNEALLNSAGILGKGAYSIASKERAFLDSLYLYKNYYFDNLELINWEKTFELAKIYQTQNLIKLLNNYYKDFKSA